MSVKLIKACKELNVGMSVIVDYCSKNGMEIALDPNTRLDDDLYLQLSQVFSPNKTLKIQEDGAKSQQKESHINDIIDNYQFQRLWQELFANARNAEKFYEFLNKNFIDKYVRGQVIYLNENYALFSITSSIQGFVKASPLVHIHETFKPHRIYWLKIKELTHIGSNLDYSFLVEPVNGEGLKGIYTDYFTSPNFQQEAKTQIANDVSAIYKSTNRPVNQNRKGKTQKKQKQNDIDKFLRSVRKSTFYDGRIYKISEGYAFVEICGIKDAIGMLLPSEVDWCLSHQKFNLLKEGQFVKCRVINIEFAEKRFHVTLKSLNNPIKKHESDLIEGKIYNGQIIDVGKDYCSVFFYKDLIVDVPNACVLREDGNLPHKYDILPFLIEKYSVEEGKIHCNHVNTRKVVSEKCEELQYKSNLVKVFEPKYLSLLYHHELEVLNTIVLEHPEFLEDMHSVQIPINGLNLFVNSSNIEDKLSEFSHFLSNRDLWVYASSIATNQFLYLWSSENYLIKAILHNGCLIVTKILHPDDDECRGILSYCSSSQLFIPAGSVNFIDVVQFDDTVLQTYLQILWKSECCRIYKELPIRLNTNDGNLKKALINISKYLHSQIDSEKNKNGDLITLDESDIVLKRTVGELPNQLAMKIYISPSELSRLVGEHSIDKIEDDFYVEVLKNNEKGVSAHLTEDEEDCIWRISFNRGVNDLSSFQSGFSLRYKPSIRHLEIQEESVNSFHTNDNLNIFGNLVTKTIQPPRPREFDNIDFFNEIFYNSEDDNNQCEAVKAALGNQKLLLIQGPPGTGKTTVIVEIIRQLIKEGKHVLVCSQANAAVDNIYKMLQDVNKESDIRMLRIGREGDAEAWGDSYDSDEYQNFLKNNLLLYSKIRNNEGSDKIEEFISTTNYSGRIDFKRKHQYVAEYAQSFECIPNSVAIDGMRDLLESQEYLDARKSNEQMFYSMDVVLGTCIGVGMNPTLREMAAIGQRFFDTVIIDEAAKANLAETIVPMRLGQRYVLVGDDNQLPPYIDRQDLQEFCRRQNLHNLDEQAILNSLSTSFFEQCHLLVGAENVITLNYQHRMHPDIGNCISHLFYKDCLKNGSKTIEREMSLNAFPNAVTFVDTTSYGSMAYEKRTNTSYYNTKEIDIIKNEILPNIKISSNFSLAIISPYMGQVQKLKAQLPEQYRDSVYTIDSIQGSEFDVVVFSFVRAFSNEAAQSGANVGFVDDMRRLNVSLSRARRKLILVGNLNTLQNPDAHKHVLITEQSDRHPLEVFKKVSSYVLSTKLLSVQDQYILFLKQNPNFVIEEFRYDPIEKVPGLFKFSFDWNGYTMVGTSLGLYELENDPDSKIRFDKFDDRGNIRYKVIAKRKNYRW